MKQEYRQIATQVTFSHETRTGSCPIFLDGFHFLSQDECSIKEINSFLKKKQNSNEPHNSIVSSSSRCVIIQITALHYHFHIAEQVWSCCICSGNCVGANYLSLTDSSSTMKKSAGFPMPEISVSAMKSTDPSKKAAPVSSSASKMRPPQSTSEVVDDRSLSFVLPTQAETKVPVAHPMSDLMAFVASRPYAIVTIPGYSRAVIVHASDAGEPMPTRPAMSTNHDEGLADWSRRLLSNPEQPNRAPVNALDFLEPDDLKLFRKQPLARLVILTQQGLVKRMPTLIKVVESRLPHCLESVKRTLITWTRMFRGEQAKNEEKSLHNLLAIVELGVRQYGRHGDRHFESMLSVLSSFEFLRRDIMPKKITADAPVFKGLSCYVKYMYAFLRFVFVNTACAEVIEPFNRIYRFFVKALDIPSENNPFPEGLSAEQTQTCREDTNPDDYEQNTSTRAVMLTAFMCLFTLRLRYLFADHQAWETFFDEPDVSNWIKRIGSANMKMMKAFDPSDDYPEPDFSSLVSSRKPKGASSRSAPRQRKPKVPKLIDDAAEDDDDYNNGVNDESDDERADYDDQETEEDRKFIKPDDEGDSVSNNSDDGRLEEAFFPKDHRKRKLQKAIPDDEEEEEEDNDEEEEEEEEEPVTSKRADKKWSFLDTAPPKGVKKPSAPEPKPKVKPKPKATTAAEPRKVARLEPLDDNEEEDIFDEVAPPKEVKKPNVPEIKAAPKTEPRKVARFDDNEEDIFDAPPKEVKKPGAPEAKATPKSAADDDDDEEEDKVISMIAPNKAPPALDLSLARLRDLEAAVKAVNQQSVEPGLLRTLQTTKVSLEGYPVHSMLGEPLKLEANSPLPEQVYLGVFLKLSAAELESPSVYSEFAELLTELEDQPVHPLFNPKEKMWWSKQPQMPMNPDGTLSLSCYVIPEIVPAVTRISIFNAESPKSGNTGLMINCKSAAVEMFKSGLTSWVYFTESKGIAALTGLVRKMANSQLLNTKGWLVGIRIGVKP